MLGMTRDHVLWFQCYLYLHGWSQIFKTIQHANSQERFIWVIPISVISGYIISNHHKKSSHLRMDLDTFRNCRFLIVHWVAFATFLGSIPDHFLFWAHNVSVNTRTLDTNGNKWYNPHGYSMYCSVLKWTLATHKEQMEWNKYVKYYISAYEIDIG